MPDGATDLPLSIRKAVPPAPPRRSTRLWLALAGGLVLAVALGLLLLRPAPPIVAAPRLTEGPVAGASEFVVGLGRLIPRSRIIAIALPFGAGDARIAELRVEEGQSVPAGTILAVMDSAPALAAALAVAEANLASREAALEQARIIAVSQRDDARASLARAESAIAANRRDLERTQDLAARGAATPQLLDQRRLAYEQSMQDAARARAALLRYDAPADIQADVVVAARAVDAARAELQRARADLDRATLRAPFAGTVLTLNARTGERPGTTGIMTFGATDAMVAEIEVYETRLHRLAPGMAVTLRAQALPAPLTGRVERIGQEILRQVLTDASPAANTDSRVGRVQVALDAPSAAVASRFVGLQVVARFAP